jgi:hypothetical protein
MVFNFSFRDPDILCTSQLGTDCMLVPAVGWEEIATEIMRA